MSDKETIKAAGALLWRSSAAGYELAIIHRQRYDDWTLPKGKLEPGETWREAALREVTEETGYSTEILGFAQLANLWMSLKNCQTRIRKTHYVKRYN